MTVENWNRVRTPEAGEDILATWPKTASSISHIIHVDTYDEAVNVCNAAARAGQPPTQARPIYFDMSNHIHKCEGRKNQRGQWELTQMTPVNTYGSNEGTWLIGGTDRVPAKTTRVEQHGRWTGFAQYEGLAGAKRCVTPYINFPVAFPGDCVHLGVTFAYGHITSDLDAHIPTRWAVDSLGPVGFRLTFPDRDTTTPVSFTFHATGY
nr:MAG TPA: hypothetical protein [Caudoviricetes sp.]